MDKPKRFAVRMTHDCGHQNEIAVDCLEMPYICGGCGEKVTVSPENLALIHTKLGATLMEADRRRAETGEDASAEWDFHTGSFR